MKASVKCHLVDYTGEGNRGPRNYSGNSPQVYFAVSDLRRMKQADFDNGQLTIPTISEETSDSTTTTNTGPAGFENIEPTISSNIIKQNMDKIQNFSEIDKMLNSINIDKALTSVNFEDELLVKMYYVGFSILMILIILKLVFKKIDYLICKLDYTYIKMSELNTQMPITNKGTGAGGANTNYYGKNLKKKLIISKDYQKQDTSKIVLHKDQKSI